MPQFGSIWCGTAPHRALGLFTFISVSTLACVATCHLSGQIASPVLSVSVPASAVLSGTVQFVAGSTKDEGQVTLKVSANGDVDESWVLGKGTTGSHTTIADGLPSCSTTDAQGKTTSSSASLFCYRQIPWFAPWMAQTLLRSGSLAGADATTEADRRVGWIRTKYTIAPLTLTLKPKKAAALSTLSDATAVYIAVDAKTLLPTQMVFYDHPNSDPSSAVEWSTSFEDYRQEAGFLLPHHLRRYVQRSLQADVLVSQFTLN